MRRDNRTFDFDIRSDKGCLYCWPTHVEGVDPFTGISVVKKYDWETGKAPWECELSDAPDWLFQMDTGPGQRTMRLINNPLPKAIPVPTVGRKRAHQDEESDSEEEESRNMLFSEAEEGDEDESVEEDDDDDDDDDNGGKHQKKKQKKRTSIQDLANKLMDEALNTSSFDKFARKIVRFLHSKNIWPNVQVTGADVQETGPNWLINFPVRSGCVCPFVNRVHARCSKGSAPNYLRVTKSTIELRCWKCNKTCERRIYAHDISQLDKNHEAVMIHDLVRVLSMITDDSTSQYIFNMVKHVNAVEQNKEGAYMWYHYRKDLHAWSDYNQIRLDVIRESGPIQKRIRHAWHMLKTRMQNEEHFPLLQTRYYSFINKLQNCAGVGGVLSFLATKLRNHWGFMNGSKRFQPIQELFNSDYNLIGTPNGVIDIAGKKLREGCPEDFISFSTHVEYVDFTEDFDKRPGEYREMFKVLYEVLNDDWEYLKWFMYQVAMSMTGKNETQSFFFLISPGGSGKSTLMDLILRALGEYAITVAVTLFTRPRPGAGQATPELADMINRRFVVTHEPDEKDELNLPMVKLTTGGGDKITSRALYSNAMIHFKPSCTVFCAMNNIPRFNADEKAHAIWRRLKTCPLLK